MPSHITNGLSHILFLNSLVPLFRTPPHPILYFFTVVFVLEMSFMINTAEISESRAVKCCQDSTLLVCTLKGMLRAELNQGVSEPISCLMFA